MNQECGTYLRTLYSIQSICLQFYLLLEAMKNFFVKIDQLFMKIWWLTFETEKEKR